MKPSSPPQAQTSLFDDKGNAYQLPSDFLAFSASASRVVDPETVDQTIERVHANASDKWKAAAPKIVRKLCESRHSFDLDDVADALKPIDHLPHEPRATGQVLRKAVKYGWCRNSGHTKSKRKSRHYGIIAEYTSLVHGS